MSNNYNVLYKQNKKPSLGGRQQQFHEGRQGPKHLNTKTRPHAQNYFSIFRDESLSLRKPSFLSFTHYSVSVLKLYIVKDFEHFNKPKSPFTTKVSEGLYLFTDLFNDKKLGLALPLHSVK